MNLDNIGVIVTGGASGLGGATATLLASKGARVTIVDVNADAGATAAAAIGGAFVAADVTNEASVAAALDAAERAHGISRILINCAGVAPAIKTVGKDGLPHPIEAFRRAVGINLIGTFNVIAQFAARLSTADTIGEERGVIINTASVAAYDGQIGQAAYALALIFVWFGCLKFTQYEAAGIAPLVMNSPMVSWWHGLFGIAGTSRMLGVYEILTGILIATRPFQPRLASIGGAMATICFLVTVSFLFTTPTTVQPGFDTPLALSPFPGQFLLKDVVLLAVSIWILFAARTEARTR